jgi:hypothetical protein
MWWLIQNILFSICLIVMIHYLYIYFETTLTSPKVKDFIHTPKQEYKILLDSMGHPTADGTSSSNLETNNEEESLDEMRSDLKKYLQEIRLNNS